MPRVYSHTSIKPKQWKRDMRYGTLNIRSLNGSGQLTTVARELSRYKIDPIGVQEVRWDKGGIKRRKLYFFIEKKTKIVNLQDFFTPQNSINS
jgi:hypothetical protein